ncbi:MAG: tryptophan synthase subunit alpha [Gammaproteobacteria bacterium]|nr:tryptophan synthase subunit alpha [Gammaproteobacteria bacterium]
MQRYETLFARLRENNEGAFVPFVMLGDPNLAECEAIIEALISGGADALELGIPFSDPTADGPVIQEAANRALAAGVTPAACLALVARLRAKYPALPMGLLVYANLVVNTSVEDFYRAAVEAGVDSVLVADVPGVEAGPFVDAASRAGIAPILIAPPNADPACIARIAAMSRGYTYVLGRAGVTGTETALNRPDAGLMDALRAAAAPPALIGFGISSPEHVRMALEAGAQGAIAGSAVVRIVAAGLGEPEAMRTRLAAYVAQMKAATRLA